MNKIEAEKTFFSYIIEADLAELKQSAEVMRQIQFSPNGMTFVKIFNEYIIDKPDYSLYDLMLTKHPDEEYIADTITRHASRKLAGEALKVMVDLSQEQAVDTIIREKKSAKDRIEAIKNLKPIVKNSPSTLNEIRNSRIVDRELEKIAPTTGYDELDALIKGFIPGHVYTMTGETNVGKTQVACNFAYRVASYNRRVLYFALEPDNTVIDYLASIWTGKQFHELTNEDLEPTVAIDVYTKDKVKNLDEMVRIVQDSERYDLIIIDHFGYFTVAQGTNKTSIESNAMKILAQLAKRNKTAILSIVHPRKPAGGAKKNFMTMNDISGSAAFKQDSTEVLLIIREIKDGDQFGLEYADTGHILVAKTKSGRPGAVPIYFKPYTALIQAESEVQPDFL